MSDALSAPAPRRAPTGLRESSSLDAVDHTAGDQPWPHHRGLYHPGDALGHARSAVGGLCAHARAKGSPERIVVWRHALRNALIPIITVAGLYMSTLIGNSVLTEIVFSRPGLGKLLVGALSQRDYTMLQGMMVIYTLAVVVVNLLSDLAYGFVDPRVKLA